MNDTQTWTVIGVLAATLISSMAFTATLFTRTLKSEIGGLRSDVASAFRDVDARFESVDRRF